MVYCLDVETFLDTDGDGCGDLPGLCERLDYLSGLGVDCVWLMPFMPSCQRDDGYDVTDFYGVDERLGTHGDLLDVVRAARGSGMRVIADLVVNHTSDQHPWFRQARESRDSPFHDFYVWRDEKPEEKPGDVVFPDQEDSNWAFDEQVGRWYMHRFYSHQPDLNVANPEVRDEIAQVTSFWLEQGLSGFRVDAVPFLIEPSGTPEGAHQDPHELLRDLRRFIGRRNGEAVLLGEVNLAPEEQRKFFGDEDGDELQLVFSFTVNQAMYLAFAREDAYSAGAGAGGAPADPQGLPVGELRAQSRRAHARQAQRRRAPGGVRRLRAGEGASAIRPRHPEAAADHAGRRRAAHPPRVLARVLASRNAGPLLRRGDRDGREPRHRGPLQRPLADAVVRSEHQAGFTTAEKAGRPLVEDGPFGYRELNVTRQRRDPDSLLNWMERLIRRRRECPELGWGKPALLDTGDAAVFALRSDWEGSTVVAVHNLAGRDAHARLELGGEGTLVDLFHDEEHDLDEGAFSLELSPYDARWFRVRRPGQRLPRRRA